MKDGIEILPGISQMDVAGLALEGRSLNQHRYSWIRYRETEAGWRINATPSRVLGARAFGMIPFAQNVVAHASAMTGNYLGPGWGVNQYIWDYSGVTEKPLFPMHTDDFDGYRALKVYVYLEDCAADQGPLVYQGKPVCGPAGTTILFDPSKEHGSYQVQRGSRYIFRAHMVERGYVLKHLPDQLPWFLKPVNKVMGWTKKI